MPQDSYFLFLLVCPLCIHKTLTYLFIILSAVEKPSAVETHTQPSRLSGSSSSSDSSSSSSSSSSSDTSDSDSGWDPQCWLREKTLITQGLGLAQDTTHPETVVGWDIRYRGVCGLLKKNIWMWDWGMWNVVSVDNCRTQTLNALVSPSSPL